MGTLKKNALYNILLSVSQVIFPLVTFPYITRVLRPDGLGAVTFVDNYTQYFILVAALGIPVYGMREIARASKDLQERSKVFTELITLHVIMSVCLSLLYVGSFLLIPKLQAYTSLFLIGSSLLIGSVFLIEWYYQGMQAFPFITIRTLCIRCIAIAAIFIFVQTKEDLVWYYAINAGAVLLNAAVNWWHVKGSVQLVFKELQFARHIKPLFFIFSTVLVTSVYSLLDSVLLGFLSTNAQVGFYTTAVKLSKVLIMLLSALTAVLVPPLALAIKEGHTLQAKALLQKSYHYVCFLAVPLSIGLFVLATPLVLLFAGRAYEAAILPLKILSPTVFIVGMNYIFGIQVLNSTGNERYFFRATLIGMLVSVSLNLLLIPHLASVGASVANLAVEFTVMLLSGYFALKKFNFEAGIGRVMQAFMASLPFFVFAYIGQYFNLSLEAELVITGFMGSLVYIAIQRYVWGNLLLADLLVSVFKKR